MLLGFHPYSIWVCFSIFFVNCQTRVFNGILTQVSLKIFQTIQPRIYPTRSPGVSVAPVVPRGISRHLIEVSRYFSVVFCDLHHSFSCYFSKWCSGDLSKVSPRFYPRDFRAISPKDFPEIYPKVPLRFYPSDFRVITRRTSPRVFFEFSPRKSGSSLFSQ